jgi:hypothetical protein
MLKFLARRWARIEYVFTLEREAAKSDINAAVATKNAHGHRTLADQLNAEADAVEANIAKVEAEEAMRKSAPEYQKLTKQEQYEDEKASKKEKDAVLQDLAEKRALAKESLENALNAEQTAQTLKGMADNSRSFAQKIRQL